MPFTKLRTQPWRRINNWKTCPIDVVFTWVDMTDPIWREKFLVATGHQPPAVRYQSHGELTFSVATIKKFAPFIRKIYIVTDDQIPPLDPNDSQIEVISHSQILGSDCCRPTFKSTSIESYLHKIPDLSEVFLYFNDDMCLGKTIKREYLFDQGVPVVDLQAKNLSFKRLGNRTRQKEHFERKPWERHIFNAAALIEKKWKRNPHVTYIHQMMVVRKSCCELAWKFFDQELAKSVTTPTRKPNTHTVSFIPLTQYIGILNGHLKLRTHRSPMSRIMLARSHLATQDKARKSFGNLLIKRPHLLCINQVSEETASQFEDFKMVYLGSSFNPYPHLSETMNQLLQANINLSGPTGLPLSPTGCSRNDDYTS